MTRAPLFITGEDGPPQLRMATETRGGELVGRPAARAGRLAGPPGPRGLRPQGGPLGAAPEDEAARRAHLQPRGQHRDFFGCQRFGGSFEEAAEYGPVQEVVGG